MVPRHRRVEDEVSAPFPLGSDGAALEDKTILTGEPCRSVVAHDGFSADTQSWLIRAAATPAPNPLSTLTTVTPAAQGVQHSEEGREATERGAIADRGRHRDQGPIDQTSDHAGQGTLHARHHDDRVGAAQARQLGQQSVQACDAHVGDVLSARAMHARGQYGLLRDVTVRGAGAQDQHVAARFRLARAHDRNRAGVLVVLRVRNGLAQGCGAGVGDPGYQQSIVRGEQGTRDFDELLRGLAGAVDHLGMSAAQLAVRVDPSVPEILEWELREALNGVLDGGCAGLHSPEQLLEFDRVQIAA